MPVPDPRDSRPAYEQIADDLRTAIKEGRLQPGDRLPTEREHAGRYGVAIGTYRQALSVLRQEGWLATHKRHGTVVLRPEQSPSPEYVELSERLDEIEHHISQLARRVGQVGKSPAPEGAGQAERLDQIEAELATLRERVDDLTHGGTGHDELKQDVAQVEESLAHLGQTARPSDAAAGLDLPGPATRR
jgi:DNA-binding transcriptional regulator YhcF (GntR family)